MSLRLRIALASAVALALVAALSSIAIYSAISDELRGETLRTLREIADGPKQPQFDGGGPSGPRRGGPDPGRFGGADGYFQLVRPDGTVVRADGDDDELPVTEEDLRIARAGKGEAVRDDVRVDGTHLLVLTVGDGDRGALQVSRPLDEVDRVLDRVAVLLAAVSAVGVLAALGLGLLVARVALRPVSRFAEDAERIAAAPTERGRIDVHGADEIARLAASFNATLDALEQSLDAQRQLIADAGHELRTPIASVRANVQVLEDAERLPAEELAALRGDIVTELDELTELLGDVIELARGSDPGAPLDDVRLDEVVRRAAERAARRGDSDVSLDLQLEPTLVQGDAARIGRAVANVIDNARKWSPADGRIEVQLEDGVLRVRDHGPGFPADALDRVFDRFWRAPDARSMPGSGLGLAIVHQAATTHGGWARAANATEGTGAVVLVSFGTPQQVEDAPGS